MASGSVACAVSLSAVSSIGVLMEQAGSIIHAAPRETTMPCHRLLSMLVALSSMPLQVSQRTLLQLK